VVYESSAYASPLTWRSHSTHIGGPQKDGVQMQEIQRLREEENEADEI